MDGRVAFVAGWSWNLFLNWQFGTKSLPEETQSLKEEIQAARSILVEFQEAQSSLEWQIWVQGWIIRVNVTNVTVHLFCLVWIFWNSFRSPFVHRPELQITDIGGSSSDTDESTSCVTVPRTRVRTVLTGRGRSGKGRPTRPSDLK